MRHSITLISLLIGLVQCQEQVTTTRTFFPMVDNSAEITLLGSTDRTTTLAAAIPTADGQPSYDGLNLMTITDNGINMSYEFTRTSVVFGIYTNGSSIPVTGNIEKTLECDYSHNYLDPKQSWRWPPINAVVLGMEEGYRDVTITPWLKTNVLETHLGTALTKARVKETGSSTTPTAAEGSRFMQSTSASATGAVEESSIAASKTAVEESGSIQDTSTQAAGAAEITMWKEAVVVVVAIAALAV